MVKQWWNFIMRKMNRNFFAWSEYGFFCDDSWAVAFMCTLPYFWFRPIHFVCIEWIYEKKIKIVAKQSVFMAVHFLRALIWKCVSLCPFVYLRMHSFWTQYMQVIVKPIFRILGIARLIQQELFTLNTLGIIHSVRVPSTTHFKQTYKTRPTSTQYSSSFNCLLTTRR